MKYIKIISTVLLIILFLSGCIFRSREIPKKITCNTKVKVFSKNNYKPISGATIIFTHVNNNEISKYNTNNEGISFINTEVPTTKEGRHVFFSTDEFINVEKDMFLPSNKVKIFPNKIQWHYRQPSYYNNEVVVYLEPIPDIDVKISSEEGDPIDGATVSLIKDNKILEDYITDSNGFVTVDGSEGDSIYVGKENYVNVGIKIIKLEKSPTFVFLRHIDKYICDSIESKDMIKDIRPLAKWLHDISYEDSFFLNDICVDEYKSNKYFSISLNSQLIFNELILSDYDIAKKYYINYVISYIRSSSYIKTKDRNLFGSYIFIKTKIKNFFEKKDEVGKEISLSYYLPETSINKFLAQEISRQQLIDESVVLINQDRVDIKLQ